MRSESWITSLVIAHEFGPLTLTSLSSFASESGFYETDSDFAVASGSFRRSRFFPGGKISVSAPDPENLGSLCGRTRGAFDRPWAFERGDNRGNQWVSELRFASSYRSGFDFLLGGFFIDARRRENLNNIGTGFDAVAQLLEAAPPFVRLETPRNNLRSFAVFGETYWKLADDFNLTLGARRTHDRKVHKNRSLLLNLPKAFDEKRLTDRAVTGRVVLDWAPDTDSPRDTLVYASLSRGYNVCVASYSLHKRHR